MSLSSSRASCLLTPVLRTPPPVQRQRARVSKAEVSEVCGFRNVHTWGDSHACDFSRRVFHPSIASLPGFYRWKRFSLSKEHFPACFQLFCSIRGMNDTYSYIKQDSFLSPSVWFWDVINFWFGVFVNSQIPELVFQHPNGRLNSCWQKKRFHPS